MWCLGSALGGRVFPPSPGQAVETEAAPGCFLQEKLVPASAERGLLPSPWAQVSLWK